MARCQAMLPAKGRENWGRSCVRAYPPTSRCTSPPLLDAFETFCHDTGADLGKGAIPMPLGRPSLHHNFARESCENET